MTDLSIRTFLVNSKVNEVIALSKEVLKRDVFAGIDIDVRFDLKGACAGQAGYTTSKGNREYFLRFNIDMIKDDRFNEILENTVPHELAHVIGFITGAFKNHDKNWKRVCKVLGGTGETYHRLEWTPAKVTKKFVYETTCGSKVTVGVNRHNKIQNGKTYVLSKTGGKLLKNCYQEI